MDPAVLAGAVEAARAGDEAGFALLWRSFQPAVLRYLRVVVGEPPEDVASRTWSRVARELPGFGGDVAAFRVWLFRIARQTGIEARRRRGRAPGHRPGAGTVPGVGAGRMDTDRALALIGTLSPDQAEAVMLRVVAGLDLAAAAAVLGRRPGAVQAATQRGLRRLAERLDAVPGHHGRDRR